MQKEIKKTMKKITVKLYKNVWKKYNNKINKKENKHFTQLVKRHKTTIDAHEMFTNEVLKQQEDNLLTL